MGRVWRHGIGGGLLLLATAAAIAQPAAGAPVTAARLAVGTTDTSGWYMNGGNFENWRYSRPTLDYTRVNATPAFVDRA